MAQHLDILAQGAEEAMDMAFANHPPVYIHGVAITVGWRDAAANLMELIFGTTRRALLESGVPIERIHSVVLAAHDLVDGRSLSSMVTAPAAGAYFRDEIRLAEDGLAALSLAAARIEAGQTEYSIVAAWGRASEGDYSVTSRAAMDPFFIQPFGLDELSLSALRLSSWIAQHGEGLEVRRRAAAARAARAARNPRAVKVNVRPMTSSPLAPDEAPRLADIVAVAIIGRPPAAVRIAGVGHSAERSSLGERNLRAMPALQQAAAHACSYAQVPREAIDIYQFAGPTLVEEALAIEALGLASAGGGFASYAENERFAPSGGSESGWCFPTGGLLNLVEGFLQITGQAGGVQVSGAPKRALVTGVSPLAGQIVHAALLELA